MFVDQALLAAPSGGHAYPSSLLREDSIQSALRLSIRIQRLKPV